jgi:hypothetical protein
MLPFAMSHIEKGLQQPFGVAVLTVGASYNASPFMALPSIVHA